MKKMLQVTNVDFTVEKLLMNLIEESSKEYDVHVACIKGEYAERLKNLNMQYIEGDRKISPISNMKTIYQLYKLMKKESYDIVHVHTPVMSVLARVAAKLAGAKNIIYTAHGFYFHDDMKSSTYNIFVGIEKFIGKYFTDYIFTQSYEDYEFAVKKKFNKKENLLCISNGINLEKFNHKNISKTKSEIRKELGILNDEIVITFIGRLVREKGILDLLEGFKLLAKEHNNIRLIVVGDNVKGDRDTEFLKQSKDILNDEIIKGKVNMLGLRNDIQEILKASDIFSLPSYREGMPRSIIEAMAMGNPVIATNIRGCREEVVDSKTGFLVDTSSPIRIKEKLEILINDSELRKNMGLEARKRAEELYDEKKVVEKQLNIFKKLLNDKGI